MKLMLVFSLCNIVLTIGVFELLLFIQIGKYKVYHVAIFRVLTWLVTIGSLLSISLLIPYLTVEERREEFPFVYIFWGISILVYFFSRYVKKQAYITNNK